MENIQVLKWMVNKTKQVRDLRISQAQDGLFVECYEGRFFNDKAKDE